MPIKVKVIGSGSIGNHLSQASRRMGWDVTVVDVDKEALRRMKEEIYPTRYGAWDSEIKLVEAKDDQKGGYDIIMIGTPPHVRMPIALKALEEKPKILLLEKPLCNPGSKEFVAFLKKYKAQKNTVALVGYDHAVSDSINFIVSLLKDKKIGNVQTLDVEFREHWKGIFGAHPWLNGPQDSYLGFTAKGGGASGEHSHALHLWQYLAKQAGLGTWKKMAATVKQEKNKITDYDSIASFIFETDKGAVGRVIQDVITLPSRKWARIQGLEGFIEWYCNGSPEGDVVKYQEKGGQVTERVFKKKRMDDFYAETLHIDRLLKKEISKKDSPIVFESGVAVMEVLNTLASKRNKAFLDIKKF
jgi:predicted dehydrogenase